LAMANILITEGLTDQDYIAQHTVGFEAFAERAAQYPVERAAALCGIEAQTIIDLARLYASASPAAIRLNYGMQRTHGGANAVRAVVSLPALIGAWRHASGGVLLSSSQSVPENPALTRPDLRAHRHEAGRVVNMSTIGDALTQDNSIKALVVYNSNPVAVAPDSESVIAGFSRDDLFTVVLEHFQTDTADYADIVLPATTQLEHFDLHKSYGHTYLVVNEAAIAPLGQAKPNSEIFRLLAAAMGFKDRAFQASDQELANEAIQWDSPRLAGTTMQTLRRDGWSKMHLPQAPFANGNFPTPSGKCEFYSERLAQLGKDPLPNYLAPLEPASEAFPLICLSPPARNFLNSTFVNVDSLRLKTPCQEVMLHPQDAQDRSLKQGQLVEVFNDRGAFQAIANISHDTRPGVIAAWGVWWHKLTTSGRNVNAVTSQALTDLGESPTFYDCCVQVRALAAGATPA
jgi:anaerobic selenocysteine-containing dehydrogenase